MGHRLAVVAGAAALACSLAALAVGRTGAQPGSLDGCIRAGKGTRIVAFGLGGGKTRRLTGAVLGRGTTGVVLANQSNRNLCSWLPFARVLAGQGFRVLLFDFGAGAPEREVAAAARKLRRLGAARVLLAGASKGAKAAIVAAAATPGLAAAVVALSPERFLRGQDVTPAAQKLTVPTLVAVSKDDPYSADALELESAVGSTQKRLVTVPGAAHGVALLRAEPSATVAAAVYSFLAPFGNRQRPPSLASECGSAVAASAPGARAVTFVAGDGARLHGDMIGTGDTTIVLAHQWPNSLCGWFPYAAELAKAGFSVLPFDHRTSGSRLDLDVVAAVDQAKARGATKVVAMGASLGGAATLVAAGRDCFPVSGIVSVSGETDLRRYGRGVPPLYAVPYASRIAAPLLVVGSEDDGLITKSQVDALLARASSQWKRAVLIDGHLHGWTLLQGPDANAEVRQAVMSFLKSAETPVATGCRS
jgi:pimeloyl-ACP methyl ester carboxylesterase